MWRNGTVGVVKRMMRCGLLVFFPFGARCARQASPVHRGVVRCEPFCVLEALFVRQASPVHRFVVRYATGCPPPVCVTPHGFLPGPLDSPCFAARIAADPQSVRDGSSLGFPCRGQPSALVGSSGTSLRNEVGVWTLRGQSAVGDCCGEHVG
jgi:hypothetical protein